MTLMVEALQKRLEQAEIEARLLRVQVETERARSNAAMCEIEHPFDRSEFAKVQAELRRVERERQDADAVAAKAVAERDEARALLRAHVEEQAQMMDAIVPSLAANLDDLVRRIIAALGEEAGRE